MLSDDRCLGTGQCRQPEREREDRKVSQQEVLVWLTDRRSPAAAPLKNHVTTRRRPYRAGAVRGQRVQRGVSRLLIISV